MKRALKYIKVLVIFLLLTQLVAKLVYGLGYLPVYVTNSHYEYCYAPNQDLYRFGNHIVTNPFGLRSPEPSKVRGIRILKIGDSVINGGAHIDQDNLSSSIMTVDLTKSLKEPVSVFNLSAQSWGPDNAYAFIQQHGDFNADYLVLVFSSHDWHDNMHFKKVVGEHQAWPDQQPICALTDAISRYAWPKIKSLFGGKSEEYDYLFDFDDNKVNSGWQNLVDHAKTKNIPILIYLHATTAELKNGQYDHYGKAIMNFAKKQEIKFIRGIDYIKSEDCYRDKIHLNTKGHARLAQVLNKILIPDLQRMNR